MKNVSHKKKCGTDKKKAHVEPPTIPLINEECTGKPYGYYVKLILRRDPTSSMSDIYEFRMFLFDHGDP